MLSLMHRRFGNPAEVLAATDMPVPAPGPGEVRIRTLLSPIHNHDLDTVRGVYGYKPPLPATGGTEAVGVVDALGRDVTSTAVGQRVAVAGVNGTWSEYFVAPAAILVPLPDTVPDEIGAQLLAMPLSSMMLLELFGVAAGQWVVLNAGSGAVGKVVAGLVEARGAHAISLVRTEASRREVEALGIPHVVATDQKGWQDKVRAMVGGGSIVTGIDSLGGEASQEILSLVSDGGTLVSFGAMSGKPMIVSQGDLIFRRITVKGFWGSQVSKDMPQEIQLRLIGELVGLASGGRLTLPVEGIYALKDGAKAMTASMAPGRKGKVLLRP